VSRALGRLVNGAFEALYGPAVPLYDWVSRVGFAGEWARWQATTLRFLRGGPTLEIGPGTGDLLPLLHRQGLDPIGLERSAPMIARARRKLARRGLTGIPLLRGEAGALPFADGAFGSVVATFPTAWVFQPDPWCEIARVLRPAGDVAVVLGGQLAPDDLGRRLRALAYWPLYGDLHGSLPPPPTSDLGLRWERVATAHGQALLLVGKRPT
jgi:ubiquinone/menaquinone biosynthesis C-methylase UbiE